MYRCQTNNNKRNKKTQRRTLNINLDVSTSLPLVKCGHTRQRTCCTWRESSQTHYATQCTKQSATVQPESLRSATRQTVLAQVALSVAIKKIKAIFSPMVARLCRTFRVALLKKNASILWHQSFKKFLKIRSCALRAITEDITCTECMISAHTPTANTP